MSNYKMDLIDLHSFFDSQGMDLLHVKTVKYTNESTR